MSVFVLLFCHRQRTVFICLWNHTPHSGGLRSVEDAFTFISEFLRLVIICKLYRLILLYPPLPE